MRTIKFRGYNRKNEKWLYGFYLQNRGQHFVCPDEFATGKSWEDYEIDPETLGQYTGLRDGDGREIYEGDLLRLEDCELAYGQVVWHPNGYFAIDRHFGKYDFSKFKCRPLGEMLNFELSNGKHLRFVLLDNIHDYKEGEL